MRIVPNLSQEQIALRLQINELLANSCHRVAGSTAINCINRACADPTATMPVLMHRLGIRPQPMPEHRKALRGTPLYVARESINTFTVFFFLLTPRCSKIS